MKKSKLEFDIELDINQVPERITMDSSDNQVEKLEIKSLMVSAWDSKKKESLTVDLLTKDIMINDMYIMYHQTLHSMASSLERSTGHHKLAGALRDYCAFFAEQTRILSKD